MKCTNNVRNLKLASDLMKWPIFIPFIMLVLSCQSRSNDFHEFEIKDVSKKETVINASKYAATDYVSMFLSGKLDGPAWLIVSGYPIECEGGRGNVDSIYLPKGVVDPAERRRDFYYFKQIQIEYMPGGAKNGTLKIKSKIL